MPIINRGHYSLDTIFDRQVGNDWPTAQVISTADVIENSSNLYYTVERARSVFSAGRGISISQGGLISSTSQPTDHNLIDDGTYGAILSDTLSNILVFPIPTNPDDRFILKSIQVTNISENDAYLSANLVFSNVDIQFANLIPLPLGSTTELLSTPQAFLGGDAVQMLGYDSSFVPTGNVVSAVLSYETRTSQPGIFRTGKILTEENAEVELVDGDIGGAVIQSIKLNNLSEDLVRAKISWKDANDVIISYFVYNLPLPINSSIEIITYPKRLNPNDKLVASLNSNSLVSAIISGRYGEQTTIQTYTSSIVAGSNTSVLYTSELVDGTVIHYSFE